MTCGCSLGVAAMLELGDKPSLLELTHGAQDLANRWYGAPTLRTATILTSCASVDAFSPLGVWEQEEVVIQTASADALSRCRAEMPAVAAHQLSASSAWKSCLPASWPLNASATRRAFP